ncbi:MAG: CoA ester lyase [Sphingomonadaceae bacterium]|nr:CoA ester lyase [Sphingomonadaceae bacterium]
MSDRAPWPPIRSALFLPASNPRAIEKARGLACDMVILDLEDAVPEEAKGEARAAAVEAVAAGLGKPAAIRVNGVGTAWHDEDAAAVAASAADAAVLPKAESVEEIEAFARATGKPVFAMIETPRAILQLARGDLPGALVGLIAGTNDFSYALRLPPGEDRAALATALQTVVLIARANGLLALDGVFNALDDAEGFEAQCREGRAWGFDGKSLIHPAQIDIANRVFGASEAEIEEARAVIAAAGGGAERFRGRMIESMHVQAAKRILGREAKPAPLPKREG